GALIDTAVYGLGHEPTVQESLRAGTDVICFSGDKLLGGPQAGIIIGREVYLNKIKKHPLARAMRADKLCLAGLSATLTHYLKEDYEEHIPIWMMIATPIDKIRTRAESWAQSLGCGEVKPGESTVGGGSLPGEILPTYLLHIKSRKPVRMIDNLRLTSPPIIARIIDDHVVFDPRTVLPDQDPALLSGIRSVMDS
ncbi:MAG: L-seryl-tRNA(Sec) selenium transferase, partial [Anaerolineae bacterium]|nr:L-seryl-tRNA(Sec) selenium transferase [Anaerolineae bacterium]NPV57989.1 L-seryl-tRNA(Sec) selenium transferase [Anaerolineae bacterium]